MDHGVGLSTPNSTGWQYQADYHFADLTEYTLYAYDDPDAPQVRMDARDVYRLSREGGTEKLIVEGRSTGKTNVGKDVSIRFDAQLTRGDGVVDLGCRLGRIRS